MEIGGYFGLDLPKHEELYSDALCFQSARATIRAVLESSDFKRILIPSYICNSIIEAATKAGLIVITYELDSSLYPKINFDDGFDKTALLYVNYFGICESNVSRLHSEMPKQNLLIDNSHALFSAHLGGLATVYSPRKFVGLPDGGLLKHSPSLNIVEPEEEDAGSIERMNYLLTRLAYSAREGYEGFNQARLSLSNSKPMKMSRLTRRLMQSLPWNNLANKRKINFSTMSSRLNELNKYKWILNETEVPLCYPITLFNCNITKIKEDLINLDIFTATYWLDAASRVSIGSIEDVLIHKTIFLPIDQRLTLSDIQYICDTVIHLIEKHKN